MGTPLAVPCLAYRENVRSFVEGDMWVRYSPLCSLPETLGSSAIEERTGGVGEGVYGELERTVRVKMSSSSSGS
jgi:hypothetical protein